MSYDPSILACALLSKDVYKGNQTELPGYNRVHEYSATDGGFFGAAYSDGKNVILAVRGTQQQQDAIDDLNMIPLISGNKAENAMKKLVIAYCKGSQSESAIQNVSALTRFLFSRKGFNAAVKAWGNRIPPHQSKVAYTFVKQVKNLCNAKGLKLRCFTGHSLGGALAQFLSEQTGPSGLTEIQEKIPAVVFNSPSMGNISGMRKEHGGGILCVNSRLDPLSMATKLAGNESHTKSADFYILVETLAMNPPPKIPSPPTPKEQGTFNTWFANAALCYHSMDNLYYALCSKFPGNKFLRDFFPNS